jgi:hypothetical protein
MVKAGLYTKRLLLNIQACSRDSILALLWRYYTLFMSGTLLDEPLDVNKGIQQSKAE